MKFTVSALIAASSVLSTVSAHGFLSGIGRLSSSERGQVRNYDLIDRQIDSLRNPTEGGLCRGAPRRKPVPLSLTEGGSLTLTQAFSIGAQHIGPCAVEIIDAKDTSKKVTLTSVSGDRGCAVQPLAQFDTNKGSDAKSQCNGKIPAGLVTNDMCLHYWTFETKNVNKITCTDCILRWTWDGTHISKSNPERYENCIDVTITKNGKGGNSDEGPEIEIPDQSKLPVPVPPTVPSVPAPAPNKPTPPAPKPETPAPKPETPSTGACSNGAYMVCDGTGFLICHPDQASRAPAFMQCASGTKCRSWGKYIQCA
ncbi:hypothetical protein DFJ77DRAFT_431640 [Powellomyces hirtus]|nr:hypothetical protein DFJ77DRAFT_431640 [Powellomyces hirtus]